MRRRSTSSRRGSRSKRHVGFFDTAAQADESTRVVAGWLREQKLDAVLSTKPKITSGDVVVHKTRELVQA